MYIDRYTFVGKRSHLLCLLRTEAERKKAEAEADGGNEYGDDFED